MCIRDRLGAAQMEVCACDGFGVSHKGHAAVDDLVDVVAQVVDFLFDIALEPEKACLLYTSRCV